MSKPQLLLERDLLIFDPWDALVNTADKTPLWGQIGMGNIAFRKTSGHGITLQIYGTIGTSDLTGKPVIEDMQVMLGDSDIYDALPEALLQELEEACLEEAA